MIVFGLLLAAVSVHLPDGSTPAVLERLGPLPPAAALAIGPSGTQAAVALPSDDERFATRLRLASLDSPQPLDLDVPGEVRDLLFALDGATLYAIEHRSAKRGAGESYLLAVDVDSLKARRALRLPSSAGALDHWPERGALLVACANEVRTLLLPDLRSGPLYRIGGANLAVSSLGGSRVLLGQTDAVLLVDLADRPGQLEMPVRDRVSAPAAVADLAAAADGGSALARLEDGRLFTVAFRPLRLEPQDGGGMVASSPPEAGRSTVPAEAVEPELPPPPAPAPSPTTAPPEPEPEPEPEALPEEPQREVDAEPAPPEPAAEEHAEPEPEPAESPRQEPPPTPLPSEPGLSGKISGPAAKQVVAVVILGPNSLLRVAARATPGPDGTWGPVPDLPPGRYRIQLDAGGGKAVVAEPPFATVDLPAGGHVQVPELRAQRVL
ncbi:MAG TPA: hypothetical protein VJS92_11135 [Candidatus Polarisedimenticolaceae bacterium]|nr:hypothetical protein [Candidatus Polarisedimenticolaceae bacterium]